MPAVPVVVTISTTVSSVLAISMLTGTTASPPSVTVTSPIVTVGTSLSSMVTVPLGLVLLVLPLVTVPSTVKVSSTSSIVSSVVWYCDVYTGASCWYRDCGDYFRII